MISNDACKFSASLEKTLLPAVLIKRKNTSDKTKSRVRGRNSIVFNDLTFQMFSLILTKGRGTGKLNTVYMRTHVAHHMFSQSDLHTFMHSILLLVSHNLTCTKYVKNPIVLVHVARMYMLQVKSNFRSKLFQPCLIFKFFVPDIHFHKDTKKSGSQTTQFEISLT